MGHWSRSAERNAAYLQRRRTTWKRRLVDEAAWFLADLRGLYERVLDHLPAYWARELAPRFRAQRGLTLIHGDAYWSNFLCPMAAHGHAYLIDWQSPSVDSAGYDLANVCATFWTSAQRHDQQRERRLLQRYHAALRAHGVQQYSWDDLVRDDQAGVIFWLLMPVQDRDDGAARDYWWPKMHCLVAAFREWRCDERLGMV